MSRPEVCVHVTISFRYLHDYKGKIKTETSRYNYKIIINSLSTLPAVRRSPVLITLTILTDVKCRWMKAELWSVNRERVKYQKN
jgi:hypothetical protein